MISVAILTCSTLDTWGSAVDQKEAGEIVSHWLTTHPAPFNEQLGVPTGTVKTIYDQSGDVTCYIVALKPAGFIVVSADNLVEPIIAFSKKGVYDTTTDNPLRALVNKDMPLRLAKARSLKNTAPTGALLKAKMKWKTFTSDVKETKETLSATTGAESYSVSDLRVSPFVKTEWGQDLASGVSCFNYYTPPYFIGSSANYLAGCVATGMAQLMRYYQYPIDGVGTTSFEIYVDEIPTTATLRGGDGFGAAYDWSNMPLTPNSSRPTLTQRKAIGALIYDAALSVNMDFASDGSSADTLDAATAFKTTFQFSNSIGGYASTGLDALQNMILPNMDARCPVLLGIANTNENYGHSIVCDGYGYDSSTLYCHLNMGWLGLDDAWYNLPAIETTAGVSFDLVTKCVYNTFTNGEGEIISGRVLKASGGAMDGVTVTATVTASKAYKSTTSYVATTDSRGIYAFLGVPSSSLYTLTFSNAGYTVVTTNCTTGRSLTAGGCGNVWNGDTILETYLPPTVILQPSNQLAVTGGKVLFKVNSTGENPLSYQWCKDGEILTDITPKTTGAKTTNLTISSITVADAGTYYAIVSNVAGVVESDRVYLSFKPTVAFAVPSNGDVFIDSSFTISGSASDIGGPGLAQVLFSVNKGEFQPATGTTNWEATLSLTNGTYSLSVKSVDVNGVESAVASIHFKVKMSAPITLATNGMGKITGAANRQVLVVGSPVNLKAVPAKGQVFSNWSGTFNVTNNPFMFAMQKDVTLTANFVSDPFPAWAGSYNGLFMESSNITHESSGFLTLTLTKSATYSGKIIGNGGRFSFSGKFNVSGAAQVRVTRKGLTNLVLNLQLEPNGTQLLGTVSDGTWTADLVANASSFTTKNPTSVAGRYTMAFIGADDTNASPAGDGYAAVNMSASGKATVSGSLANGIAVSQTVPVSTDARIPLYVSLVSGKGSFFGWIEFQGTLSTNLHWFVPAVSTAKYYKEGFQREVPVVISPFVYTKGARILDFESATIALGGGNLSSTTNGILTLSANNVFKADDPLTKQLTLSVNKSNGFLSGTYTDAVTKRKNLLKGVVLQNQTNASGYFLGTNLSGLFFVQPQ